MAYAHATLNTMLAALAARLHDPSFAHWSSLELTAYLKATLRTWNAAAAVTRGRMTVTLVSGSRFYDLGTQAGTLLPRTVTDAEIMELIEYHLLEPATTASWTGSEQFTWEDVRGAIERRRNQFLLETGVVVSHSQLAYAPDPDGRAVLADTTIDVRRLSFKDPDGVFTHLWREDEYSLQCFDPAAPSNPRTPYAYAQIAGPPLTLQLAPPPADSGTLDLLTVSSGATLDPAAGVALGIPDDLAWVVAWGALADLLGKDGPGFDGQRAAYCEQRWQEGLEIARLSTTVLQARWNTALMPIDSISDLDHFRTGWENETPGEPEMLALAGWNMLVAAPPADGNYVLTIDVLRNFPIPAAAEYVQVGREHLDVLLDYAEHLALFKSGGAEFQATSEHYKRFMRLASQLNQRWRAAAVFADVLHDRARLEEEQVPRRDPANPAAISASMEDR